MLDKKGHKHQGDPANICGRYAKNLFRLLFGTHQQIFSISYAFFPHHFQDPPIFFPKIQIFSSEIWRPTHISTENLHLPNFRPLNSRPLSVFEGLFGDIWFFDEFRVFELYKHVKS